MQSFEDTWRNISPQPRKEQTMQISFQTMSCVLVLFLIGASALKLDFGKIQRLHINLGPNTTPLMPDEADETMGVLAVEANVQLHALMPQHPRLFVIYCAIAAKPGFAQFHVYNYLGLSGSLSKTNRTEYEFSYTTLPQNQIMVPALSLGMLLDSIPSHVRIPLLKTDLQGFDYAALQSAGRLLQRVDSITAECYAHGTEMYAGVVNECDRDIDPLLTRLGFRLVEKISGYKTEFDVTYKKL